MKMKFFTNKIRAIRWVTIAFGLMASITGIMSGIFKILQRNYPTYAFKISSIDPVYSMWKESTYAAYTIIPNYLITGIVTLVISILVTIWVLFFIHKKYGSIVMVLLSLLQFFSGGGVAIDVAILSAIMSTQINRSHLWWSKFLSEKIHRFFAKLWPWAFAVFILLALANFILAITGVNSPEAQQAIVTIAGLLFLPILLSVFCGFSYDLQRGIG